MKKNTMEIPKELTNRINKYSMKSKKDIRDNLKSHVGEKLYHQLNLDAHIDKMFEDFDIIPKSAAASFDIRPSLSLENIEKCILKIYKISPVVFKSKTRKTEVVWARKMFSYIAREAISPRYTSPEIAKYLNQDHATVLHSVSTAISLLETETERRMELHHLRVLIMEIVNAEGEINPKRGLNEKEIQVKSESLPDINVNNEPLPEPTDPSEE